MDSSPGWLRTGTKRQGEKAHKKCEDCRRKKIKCLPSERDWSVKQKCFSCERSGLDCGPNRRFNDGPVAAHAAPTPRPPLGASITTASSPTLCSESNFSHVAPEGIENYIGDNGTHINGATADPSTTTVSTQTIPESSAPSSSQPMSAKTEEFGNVRRRFTGLGHLRIALENIRGLQRYIGPQLVTDEAKEIKHYLRKWEWCLSREYSKCFKELIKTAEESETQELMYLKLLGDVNSIDGDRATVADIRATVLQRLIKIYRDEDNLPAVERMWKQLSDASYLLREPDNAVIATNLAQCYLDISAEGRKIFEDLDLCAEAPLHSPANSLFPAIHRALRGGEDDVSRVLCEIEAPLMEIDMLRQNVVVAAAATGKTALLGPILSCKSQMLTEGDVLGRTALSHAAHRGNFDSYQNLVRAGANIHDRDASGLPILSVAVARGSVNIVRDLLARGASPNPVSFDLPSPLHEATKAGNQELCEVLLAEGAWADWRSPPDGKTPCQVAREKGFNRIASLLEGAAKQPENHFSQCQSIRSSTSQQNVLGQSLSEPYAHAIGAFDYRAVMPAVLVHQEPSFIAQHTPSVFSSPRLDREPEYVEHTPRTLTTGSPLWINAYIASTPGTSTDSAADEHEHEELT